MQRENSSTMEFVTAIAFFTVANTFSHSIGVEQLQVIFSKPNETEWIKYSNPFAYEELRLLAPCPFEKNIFYSVSKIVNMLGVNDISIFEVYGRKITGRDRSCEGNKCISS